MKISLNEKYIFHTYSFAINDVHEKNEYYWRYQRYQLIREYFEKPKFVFPPLSLFIYILMLIRLIYRRRMIPRVFSKFSITLKINKTFEISFLYSEILATPELDKTWTDFENAATYEYARDFVEEKYRSSTKVHVSS